jgi:hypothetical protein
MTKSKPVELPKTMSGLLRLAVADARAVAKLPGYRLRMWKWHQPERARGRDVCSVCMAGAVMVNTLQLSPTRERSPWDMPQRDTLEAINAMRVGGFLTAAHCLSMDPGLAKAFDLGKVAQVVQADYNEALCRAPWRTYLKAADMLEELGL